MEAEEVMEMFESPIHFIIGAIGIFFVLRELIRNFRRSKIASAISNAHLPTSVLNHFDQLHKAFESVEVDGHRIYDLNRGSAKISSNSLELSVQRRFTRSRVASEARFFAKQSKIVNGKSGLNDGRSLIETGSDVTVKIFLFTKPIHWIAVNRVEQELFYRIEVKDTLLSNVFAVHQGLEIEGFDDVWLSKRGVLSYVNTPDDLIINESKQMYVPFDFADIRNTEDNLIWKIETCLERVIEKLRE